MECNVKLKRMKLEDLQHSNPVMDCECDKMIEDVKEAGKWILPPALVCYKKGHEKRKKKYHLANYQ